MRKIRKGDEVIIISGNNKGVRGSVLKVLNSGNKVLVEGLNFLKKHVKPNPQKGISGGIIEKEAPLQASNVAIYNSSIMKADRVGFKFLENGKKVRYFKSNNELIDR